MGTVDDPLDAFPVHFGGGFFGIVAVAFFMEGGIFFDPSRNSAAVSPLKRRGEVGRGCAAAPTTREISFLRDCIFVEGG